jgi:hypothetical protein
MSFFDAAKSSWGSAWGNNNQNSVDMTAPVIALRKPSIALTVLGQVVRPYLGETASNADQACEVAQMLATSAVCDGTQLSAAGLARRL